MTKSNFIECEFREDECSYLDDIEEDIGGVVWSSISDILDGHSSS